ncbi:hypothetical protein [Actinomyces ruminicola]|uniref:hypothetical protein n=1 Tax=Actinomyces ruminicola TaxID=332524 RepID=UPI0037BFE85F
MENHSTALRVWENHDVREALCVHLDAHLDIGWLSGESVRLAADREYSLAGLHERDCLLHTREGHYDIANWLGVALAAGMVSELFWVVPDEVWFNSSRQLQELLTRQIGQVSIASFAELGRHKSPYRFMTGKTEIVVCTLEQLPLLHTETLLLDIDLDYFARYRDLPGGRDWSEPSVDPADVITELRARVPHADVTTVSLSWHGGYLPYDLLPRVLPLCEGAETVQGGDVWSRQNSRGEGPYADYTRACGLLHRKRPAEAMPFARRAVRADPQVGAYHYAESVSASATGDLLRAAEARDLCLSSGTVDSAQVLNDFAGITARLGDLEDALLLQEKALVVDQVESPIISGNLMALYAQAGRWDRAKELAQLTVTRQPFCSEAFVVLATAAQHHGDRVNAVDMWEHAAECSVDVYQKASYRRRADRLRSNRRELNYVRMRRRWRATSCCGN